MTERRPFELAELFDGELESLPAPERTALEHAHRLLLEAGPLPELSASLSKPPPLPRRWRPSWRPSWPSPHSLTGLRLAASLSLLTLLLGFGIGSALHSGEGPEAYKLSLHPQAITAGAASGSLAVYDPDKAGNRRLVLSVRGLPSHAQGYYLLLLRQPGSPPLICGAFQTSAGAATVRMTVPYALKGHPRWLVVSKGPGGERTLLTTAQL